MFLTIFSVIFYLTLSDLTANFPKFNSSSIHFLYFNGFYCNFVKCIRINIAYKLKNKKINNLKVFTANLLYLTVFSPFFSNLTTFPAFFSFIVFLTIFNSFFPFYSFVSLFSQFYRNPLPVFKI